MQHSFAAAGESNGTVDRGLTSSFSSREKKLNACRRAHMSSRCARANYIITKFPRATHHSQKAYRYVTNGIHIPLRGDSCRARREEKNNREIGGGGNKSTVLAVKAAGFPAKTVNIQRRRRVSFVVRTRSSLGAPYRISN